MKRILTFGVLLFLACNFMSAKKLNDEPLHRNSGYKGSVSLTDHLIVFIGLDTSHGYMFNEHHYLGGGAGFFLLPFDSVPAYGRVFADYKAYFMKRNSTPTAGLQAGYCMAFKDLSGNAFQNAFEVSPHIGWNWAYNEKISLDLSIGAAVFLHNNGGPSTMAKAMPKISIGIEF